MTSAMSLCYQRLEVMRPKMPTVMAATRPTGQTVWISVFLLLILTQMLTLLLLFTGVVILSSETFISPFHFCSINGHEELSCDEEYRKPVSGTEYKIKINILTAVVILGLYIPVVLVAFAVLAMLLGAYAKDRAAVWFSMACQSASGLLILIGIIAFLLLNQSYVSWEHMTVWFYMCGGAQVQQVIMNAVTHVSGTRLTSDWE